LRLGIEYLHGLRVRRPIAIHPVKRDLFGAVSNR
jgi:hypothetical protein